jgi:hypothetical protein
MLMLPCQSAWSCGGGGRGCVWKVGRGVPSGGARGREPASDWPPEGMTRPARRER